MKYIYHYIYLSLASPGDDWRLLCVRTGSNRFAAVQSCRGARGLQFSAVLFTADGILFLAITMELLPAASCSVQVIVLTQSIPDLSYILLNAVVIIHARKSSFPSNFSARPYL